MLGELICDHSESAGLAEEDYDSFGVYGVEPDNSRKVLVAGLLSEEEAEGLADILKAQLQIIKTDIPLSRLTAQD